MFELEELPIPGAFVLHSKSFKDERGEFRKIVHKETFEKLGLEWSFDEQFYSVSNKDVVRGMHIQLPPHDHVKYVYCVSGQIVDVLLDLRKDSTYFGKTCSVKLDRTSSKSVYIPKGVAHGFRALEDQSVMMYSVTAAHAPHADTGVLWSSIDFDWGVTAPLVSPRDQALPPLERFKLEQE